MVLPHQPSNAEGLETRGYEMFPQSLPALPPFSQRMATVAKDEITLTLRAADGQLYTAVLQAEIAPGFDGYYNAHVRELPGCITYGEDLRRAVDNLREALSLYLESE
jgi:predicted RNase H-like HicB family nuclease